MLKVSFSPTIWVLAALLCAPFATFDAHADEPIFEFTVVEQDTLIGLSNSVLISPTAWREVSQINKLANPNLILPGQVLRIPVRLMRTVPVQAKLVAMNGDVQVGAKPAALGMALAEGDSVQTGASASAVVELADRSRVQIPPSSLAELAASRKVAGRDGTAPASASAGSDDTGGWFAGTLRLVRGSVEVFATKVLRVKPLEVVTPTAVIGVRGTQYRVSYDEAANRSTHSEVVEGKVRFDRTDRPVGADLVAGFGAQVDAGSGGTPVATKLLDAPDLSGLTQRYERPLVRLAMPEGSGAVRLQVASDPAFDSIVSDQRIAAGEPVRIADLDDGRWHLRARRIDPRGIEGHDARLAFVLKARPEPPANSAPRSDAKQAIGSVEFAWAQNIEAPRARLQVAQDAAFNQLVLDQDNLSDGKARAEIAAPGTYYWRLASIRPDSDHGPFGDPQRFELRALPTPPSGGVAPDGTTLAFTWSGRPGDRQHVELARDPQFKEIVASDELGVTEWRPPVPASGGRYFFRYRSVEPDGYVSPYSATLMFEIARDKAGLLLLLPFLLLL